jgi:hypothetical protein
MLAVSPAQSPPRQRLLTGKPEGNRNLLRVDSNQPKHVCSPAFKGRPTGSIVEEHRVAFVLEPYHSFCSIFDMNSR